jgi:eukaryotic-like serine/threonine-protein kinase
MIARGARLKDRYRLERLLGRGGMASVWLATDEVLERPVAIKVLSDTIASDPEFLARFRREARLAARLSHPNLIGVYDYAEGEERPYLVMEYVSGETLTERMSRGAAIDCERLARELFGALAHIHAAGIVHRDVKPQNVLIDPEGDAKLIDFGIALPRDATSLTHTGHLLGTARYIAPEVMHGEPATERSDLYSSGVLLRDCVGDDARGRLALLADRLSAVDPGDRPPSAAAAAAQLGRKSSAPKRPTEPFVARPQPTEPLGPVLRTSQHHPPRAARSAWARVAALTGIAAGLVAAILLIADGPSGDDGGKVDRSAAASRGDGGAETTNREEAAATPPAPAPEGNDPALGSSLNQEGFELIQAGRHEEAVPVLEEAVRAFPADTDDLNYAYALFNLGNALRLSGRPEEAIPVLARRLEIPNQTDVVSRELAAARSAAG